MSVSRFGVSLEKELLSALDEYVSENNFANRSQAIRYLVEKNIAEKKWKCNNIVAGALIILYESKKRDIAIKSYDIRHEYFDVILSSQHFQLSHDVCLEIIAVKGQAYKLTELADKLIAIKGLKHGKLIMGRAE
jgi:CopG family transcriptional regulator, nickel-responsive regulator